MLRKIRLKFLFLLILTVASIAFVLPSFTDRLPSWWQTYVGRGINLGLDLKGGMHLILQVDMEQAVQNFLSMSSQDLKELAEKRGLSLQIGAVSQENLAVTLLNQDEQAVFNRLLKDEFSQLEVKSTQRQGTSVKYLLDLRESERKDLEKRTQAQSLEVLRNRIDQFGVREPVIAPQTILGAYQIVVQLPGIQDPQRAMDLIGKTAQLEFKLVDDQTQINLDELIEQALADGRLKPGYSHEELNRVLADKIPPNTEVFKYKSVDRQTGSIKWSSLLLEKKVLLTGAAIKGARVRYGDYNEPEVLVDFNSLGAKRFDQITAANVKRRLAIVLDNVVQSAPVIQERISGGTCQITGSFTPEEASDLAIVLRAGALPASVKIVQNITVGPTLGLDSIHKGIFSGLLGTLLVVAFMFIYYRLSGLVANYALILNLIMIMGALSLFNATLTLPGIAGIILSVGMAVDSNVLIYERMREEFHAGKPLKSGIDGGYDKAFWTIIDSHVTTLITAMALFLFGTGPIKGFAVTLSLGVALNLFTALFGTRVVYDYLLFKRWLQKLSFLEFFKQPHINFMGYRKIAFAVSAVLCLLGLFAFVQLGRGHGNLGVDFAGGAMVQFTAQKPFTVNEVRQALTEKGWQQAEIQSIEGGRGLMVKLKKSDASVGQMAEDMSAVLNQSISGNSFKIEGTSEIGASVSKYLRNRALLAIGISLIGIILYLAWRFELIFGIAAATATFHDVLAVLGIFYLLNKEISLLVVTALLTLAGYSLTDTVVVFDRIRENLGRRRESLYNTLNNSINEVLSRTIVTSLTVILVLLALLLFGGLVIHDFALALLLGVMVGSYSSVFVASPIIYGWRQETKKVVIKKEKVIELAAQKQKKAQKRETANRKKKGSRR
ncbi:MAG: preprotein translocase subunit SecF [Desulfobacca sp. 4484_104]|nr:MAG: preprotein translocase subunit SecF [Desulfobacca sp. 4484_104]RLA89213.1 MAG: protein translocase subunit SecDF [Deltaproteobacteria bacterium]